MARYAINGDDKNPNDAQIERFLISEGQLSEYGPTAGSIFWVLGSKEFHDWYTSNFEAYLKGASSDQDKILKEITKIFSC